MFHTIYQVFKLVLAFCLVATMAGYASTTKPLPAPAQKPAGQIAENGKTCDVWNCYAGKYNPDIEKGQSTYNDPFAYCAAVGTIDIPDKRYNGVKIPNSIIQGMIRQGIISADAPPEFQQNTVWRCMNHKVWVCQFGANIPCLEKADISRMPISGMVDYCKISSTTDNIPAYVTGRATIYEWRCKDGKPEVVKQLFESDPQGYLTAYWYELTLE